MDKEFLRKLPLFAELGDADLERLYSLAQPINVPKNSILMKEGDRGDALFVIVDGEFEVTKWTETREVMLSLRHSGEVIGEMSLLDQAPRSATVRALSDSNVLKISRAAFDELLAHNPSAVAAVLYSFASRMRNIEQVVAQTNKLAGLGQISAGLAHEVNNPASAGLSNTTELRKVLTNWQQLTDEIDRLGLDAGKRARLNELRAHPGRRRHLPVSIGVLGRSDLVDEVDGWLTGHGVPSAWELASDLVDLGWQMEPLEALAEDFSDAQLGVIVPWLVAGLKTYRLLDDVQLSFERITALVRSVKSYTHMDRAPVQDIRLQDGLEDTLVILRPKITDKIKIVREYSPETPIIEAYAGELNQVWTNLIDNALDVLHESGGTVTLRTYRNGDNAVVEVEDSGPGIPADTQKHLFEPFFTTKEPGKGTGMGLYLTYNIVTQQHRGNIEVQSQPGSTIFRVTLPIRLEHIVQ